MYIDNKFCCSVSLDTITKFNLYKQKKINDEQLKKIHIEESYFYLIQKVLKYIYTRNRSTKEIDDYIDKHIKQVKIINISKNDIENIKTKILKKLKEYKLIDDYKFSENLIKSKISKWKYSKKEIKFKLIHYGIKKDVYETILNKLYTNEIEQKTIGNLIKKKKKQNKTKIINYLLNKGFNYTNIKKLI